MFLASRVAGGGAIPSLVLAALLCLSALTFPAAGQEQDDGERRWWNLGTEASEHDRLILGMWTIHINHMDEGWSNNGAVVAIHRGFYGATFRTTHGPRAISFGVERSWATGTAESLGGMLGFRAGLVYGYDGRLGWVAEKTPVLPFIQPLVHFRAERVSVDLTYTWVVISIAASVHF